jgi:hypothetical protein
MTDSLDQALSERFALQHDELSLPDFADVVHRAAEIAPRLEVQKRPSAPRVLATLSVRRVLVAALVLCILAGTGVAIAAGFGAFNGISAAQHPQTPADKIDPAVIARINGINGIQGPGSQLLADSSRLLRQLSGGGRLYVVARKDGGLCVLAVGLSGTKNGPSAMGCGSPLTQSQPTTISSFKAKQGTPTINWGIALDHINAISFDLGGRELTVPVTNNAWAYEGPSPRVAQSIVIHYDDGTARSLTP